MSNIIQYVENEMDSFEKRPFGEVDSLVLSQLSYLRFEDLVPPPGGESVPLRELFRAETFPGLFGPVRAPEDNRALFTAAVASPRFRDLRLTGYVSVLDQQEEKQFSALTFLFPDGSAYLAFRGTDGTLVGWKEDFNMAYRCPVPAQQEGASYLETMAKTIPGALRLGGHSKGGNIAVYAAMAVDASLRARLRDVYSHDGPGFRRQVIEGEDFAATAPLVRKTLPQSSLIGMLLQSQENYTVVKSDNFWIYQHDPFSWQVEQGDFIRLDQVTGGARYLNETLGDWLESLPDDRRQLFVDTVFDVIQASGAKTLSELGNSWTHSLPMLYEAGRELDPETRQAAADMLRELLRLAVRHMDPREDKGKKIPETHAEEQA